PPTPGVTLGLFLLFRSPPRTSSLWSAGPGRRRGGRGAGGRRGGRAGGGSGGAGGGRARAAGGGTGAAGGGGRRGGRRAGGAGGEGRGFAGRHRYSRIESRTSKAGKARRTEGVRAWRDSEGLWLRSQTSGAGE